MTQHTIRYEAGRYVCGTTETGRDFRRTGCAHVLPASAIAHSDTLQAAFSVSAEPPHPSSVSLHETAQVGGSAESRERFTRSEEAAQ